MPSSSDTASRIAVLRMQIHANLMHIMSMHTRETPGIVAAFFVVAFFDWHENRIAYTCIISTILILPFRIVALHRIRKAPAAVLNTPIIIHANINAQNHYWKLYIAPIGIKNKSRHERHFFLLFLFLLLVENPVSYGTFLYCIFYAFIYNGVIRVKWLFSLLLL